MNLDVDLQRILNIGAKVYDVNTKKQGKVIDSDRSSVQVDYGSSVRRDIVDYEYEEFCALLVSDQIVANYRLTMGVNDGFKINPRTIHETGIPCTTNQSDAVTFGMLSKTTSKESQPPSVTLPTLDVGYVNFTTGRFSTEPKKGYTKVEYKRAVEKVTIEVDSEMMDKLREMGVIK